MSSKEAALRACQLTAAIEQARVACVGAPCGFDAQNRSIDAEHLAGRRSTFLRRALVQRMTFPAANAQLALLSKCELRALADGLIDPDPWVVERCVEFVLAETRGLWHGRARAMMCRRLKHCSLGRSHRTQLVDCIVGRLVDGTFSEQFKDQLHLAMHLDPTRTLKAAQKGLDSRKTHVQRYAAWVLLPRHRQNEL